MAAETTLIEIDLPEETLTKLEAFTERFGVSLDDTVAWAIRFHLWQHRDQS